MMKKIMTTLFVGLCWLLFTPVSSYASSNGNWMSDVDDSKFLSQISIPGTHDSAALYESISGTAKCQNLTLDEQFNSGVRYIDIRCRSINDSFTIHHGSVYQHLNFDDIINECTDFLKNNPTETIIMSVKEEYKSSDSEKTFEEIFSSYVENNKDIWLLSDEIPQLGEARGKIVLLRRFKSEETPMGIDASEWEDNTTFSIENASKLNIQDSYKVGNNNNKWSAITSLYNRAKSSSDNSMYINYTSGYKSILGVPNITSVSNYINSNLMSYFKENDNGCFGISVMDFVNEEICREIIATNFN